MKGFIFRIFQSSVAVLIVFVIAGTAISQFARAATWSWLQGDPTGRVLTTAGPSGEKCINQKVHIGSPQGEEATVCVYQAKGWRYGVYTHWISTSSYSGYNETNYVISFGSELAMYQITGIPVEQYETPIYVPDSNNFIYHKYVPNTSNMFDTYIVKDFPSKLEKSTVSGVPVKTSYRLKAGAAEPLIKNDSGGAMQTYRTKVSDNGRWLVAEVRVGGFVRIDMHTFDMNGFSKYIPDYDHGSSPKIEFAVSDDGKYVATTGWNMETVIYELNGTCGWNSHAVPSNYLSAEMGECPKRDVYHFIDQIAGGSIQQITQPSFDSEAGEFTVHTTPNPGSGGSEQWVTLRADGYTPLRLDYLALGDSYSSGEGDTEINLATNAKYYRYNTNNEKDDSKGIPREKCHVSTRSYPYLLARSMDLALDQPKQWDTVACSGATAWDVKVQGSMDYEGQAAGQPYLWSSNPPRLEGYNVDILKNQALNEFIPGRQKQIEFVKKYQPKAITLTMGGNDVDFGGKISKCIMPVNICELATDVGRKKLGVEIKEQFKNLTTLYQELHDTSPSTKIYVLGYPQVINGVAGDIDCVGYSIGGLDASERRAMAEGYSYINQVIEAAAKYVGVKYIYVEDALNSHRICDGVSAEHYVTGFTFGNPSSTSNERQESFHPNAKGNQAIMDKVKSRLMENEHSYTPLTYPYTQQPDKTVEAPIPTPYLASDSDSTKVESTHMMDDSATKNQPTAIRKGPLTFASGSEVDAELHSDPINLGRYTVNSDGSLDATIVVPLNTPSGYHTLTLSGKTYSGEPIQYEQTVFIHGADLNDLDDDGIPDNADKCLFVEPSNTDIDSDGVDDACDIDVGQPKDSYRLRAGDPSHQYAGSSESADYLYLERNIYATQTTGVSGDYDTDHDGWVIIATTKNNIQAGPYAKFWVDGSNGSKVPHVSFRTAESGCVQYRPSDLSKITVENSAAARTFVQEVGDTNTCRSDAPTADLDKNGLPDNTQPLYRARSGDINIKHVKADGTTFSEDPSRLYLERSTRAAEAQLGKSDFAPNDSTNTLSTISSVDTTDYRQNWSLLASSPSNTVGFLNNLTKYKFMNNFPYVVTGYTSQFYTSCSVYKPESIDTIRRTTQATRSLQLDFMQTLMMQFQGGCND